MDATRRLARYGQRVERGHLPAEVEQIAQHCLLDWLGTTLAGAHEPLSQILCTQIARADRSDEASLVGFGRRASLLTAALQNGTSSHALDYDDTHWTMQGHPSAPVLGALFGLAEREHASGAALLAAFVAGVEVECRLGRWLNPSHYARGFHATGTLGTFGAAAACAHLLGLEETGWLHALGLAGTQAAGLKSGFGSMAKPLHVGRAAHAGLLSAQLAAAGFTGQPRILEDPQGFALTHADALVADALEPERWLIRDTLFKYHAACHLTHATIDGVRALVREHALEPAAVSGIDLTVDETCLGVCNIARPETGLEAKFSLRATAALALLGADTTDPTTFSDAQAAKPALRELCERVSVRTQPMAATRSVIAVHLRGGRRFETVVDSGIPATDLQNQGRRLRTKFERLCAYAASSAGPGPTLTAARVSSLADCVLSLCQLPDVAQLGELLA
jgi:2-methylcitrate dehydratase PrpD